MAGSVHTTSDHGKSLGVIVTENGRCFFSLNLTLPHELRGAEIPHFTTEDADKVAQENYDIPVFEGIKFGDLYQAKERAVLVALQDYVFPKWHYGRIITLGDAAHKVRCSTDLSAFEILTESRQLHPVTGHGAMSAIEDNAAFSNHLLRQLDNQAPSSPLSTQQIRTVFEATQSQRQQRVTAINKNSFFVQSMQAWANPLYKVLHKYITPRLSLQTLASRFSAEAWGASKIEGLKVPFRPRKHKFDDEIVRSGLFVHLGGVAASSLLVFLAAGLGVHYKLPALIASFKRV